MINQVQSECGFRHNPAMFAGDDPQALPDKIDRAKRKVDAMYDIDFLNPSYGAIFSARLERLKFIRQNPEKLDALKVFYAQHPVEFIQDWGCTYDPRVIAGKNKHRCAVMPFILFPRQREYIMWLKDMYDRQENGLAEKCRDVGFTWLNVAFAVWMWLFHDGVAIGFGSRKQDLVDRLGDPDCIFEKMRMFIKYLPPEFTPSHQDSFLKLINRENNASITGEAGVQIGRGGRKSIYFKDESAFYERPDIIEAALSQNSNCKIDCSTVNGMGNPFYKKRHSFPSDRIFIFDWRQDPRKTEAWYKKQSQELEPHILAQEVDRDYGASVEGICIPTKWVQAAVNFPLEPTGMIRAMMDVSDEGKDLVTYVKMHGSVVQRLEGWNHGKEGDVTTDVRRVNVMCGEDDVELFRWDNIGVGADVKGELRSLHRAGTLFTQNNRPFDSRGRVSPGMWNEDKSNKNMFRNARAEAWWRLRQRFWKTWQMKNGIKEHPPEELISIPNHAQLIAELSSVKVKYDEAGKIVMESKKEMRDRGVHSPDYADGLAGVTAPFSHVDDIIATGAEGVNQPTVAMGVGM